MESIDFTSTALEVFLSGLRLSTPLLFAALGGLLSERAGVANIALEGFLLVGAFAGAAGAYAFQDPYIGLVFCVFFGAAIAALFGFFTVIARADHIVVGTGINLLVLGLIPLIAKNTFGVAGSTPSLAYDQRLSVWIFFWLAIVLAFIMRVWIHRSRFGLHLRAVGENLEASKSVGISVQRTRFLAVVGSGMLAALGGAFLSIAHGSQYARGMTAGRGFIALAALILASWRPIPVLISCFVFGLADAAQILLQSYELPNGQTVPVQFIQMFPYVVTLFFLVVIVGRTRAPAAIGRNDY